MVLVPHNNEGLQGQWVSCREACFLERQGKPGPQVIAAGRRAGLLIPDIPANAQHVSTCKLATTAVRITLLEVSGRAGFLVETAFYMQMYSWVRACAHVRSSRASYA